MITLLYIFLSMVVVKFAINIFKYFQCRTYLHLYQGYVKEPDLKFEQHQPQIIRLLQNAGVEDSTISVESFGFSGISNNKVSVFSNITNTRQDVVEFAMRMIYRAIGVYHSRYLESLNPLYWIEFFIYLPKHIFNYFGVSPERVIVKISQLIYWLAGLLANYGLFRDEIEQIIRRYLFNVNS